MRDIVVSFYVLYNDALSYLGIFLLKQPVKYVWYIFSQRLLQTDLKDSCTNNTDCIPSQKKTKEVLLKRNLKFNESFLVRHPIKQTDDARKPLSDPCNLFYLQHYLVNVQCIILINDKLFY